MNTNKPQTSMKRKAADVLEMVFAFASNKNGSDDYRTAGKLDIPEAQAALCQDLLELIGEDIDPGKTRVIWTGEGGVKAENADTLREGWSNKLRAELRTKVKAYFGQTKGKGE